MNNDTQDTTTRGPLRRSPDGFLGGVCGGLSSYLDTDVAFVRIAMLLVLFSTGPLAVLGYGIAWASIPIEGQVGRPEKVRILGRDWSPGQAVLGGLLMLALACVIGGGVSLGGFGLSTTTILALGIGAYVLTNLRGDG